MSAPITIDTAADVARQLEIDFTVSDFTLDDFHAGMLVELEHGSRDPRTNVTDDDPLITGKIALAHLLEFGDYYTLLEAMERAAEARTAR